MLRMDGTIAPKERPPFLTSASDGILNITGPLPYSNTAGEICLHVFEIGPHYEIGPQR